MTNPQLKRALTTVLGAERREEPSNSVLLDELRFLREEMAEMKKLKQEVAHLSDGLEKAYKIIHNQQLFLEKLDSKERRCNLVMTGLLEDPDEIGETDKEKVVKVLEAASYPDAVQTENWEMKRLGRENEHHKRPLLITVENQEKRDGVLRVAKNLKNVRGSLSTIYIKKDLHPAVRKEYARLRTREREEREKPVNVGANITYDRKDRVLLRDGVVIDRGGVVMLVSRWLTDYVSRVDTDVEGQIWLQLSWWPNVNLGGVYIPPEDSPYYHASQFGEVAARTRGSEKTVVMGDFNARVCDGRLPACLPACLPAAAVTFTACLLASLRTARYSHAHPHTTPTFHTTSSHAARNTPSGK
ncbi:hypothetical protein O3P69_015593, partial [Scylla paramamosain]